MTNPTVTIVIPAYNEEDTICECLDSLMELDFPKESRTIIIVDDGSTDRTREIVRQYDVTLITTDHAGPSIARNLGITRADSDYIALTDADCRAHRKWLSRLVSVLETNPEAAAVGGSQQAVPDDPPLARRIQQFLEMLGFLGGYTKDHRSLTPVEHNASCNTMYRKQCLVEVGGFLPGLFPGEDVELDYRMRKAGYCVLFEPEAIVYHHRPRTYIDFFKMIFGYSKGSGGFLLRRYGVMRPFHLLFPLFIFLFVADIILMFQYSLMFTLFHIGMVVVLWFAIFLKIRMFHASFTILLLFMITLLAWNSGFVRGLFWTTPSKKMA